MVIKQYNKEKAIADRVKIKFALFPKRIGDYLIIWEKYYKVKFIRKSNNEVSTFTGRTIDYCDKIDFYNYMSEAFEKYLNEFGESQYD